MGQQWAGAGSGDLNTTILGAIGHAGTSPFERGHNYSYHSLASGKQCIPQGNTAPSISRNICIKNLLSMAPPIRARPRFPHSQSLPSGSYHKPLILIQQRAGRNQRSSFQHPLDHKTARKFQKKYQLQLH